MDITIKRLSPELIPDYFDFFDNRAFTDNPPWGGCYCIGFQMTKDADQKALNEKAAAYGGQEGFMRALRECVVSQITSGALRGYLAYVDGKSIGWCNCNDRANYPENAVNGEGIHMPDECRERAVVCFEIAPEYRGKGVATALLTRAVSDAREEGCSAFVAFPEAHADGVREVWDFKGPIRLYEKLGFVLASKEGEPLVMRKEL